jgi:hypothetical protein
LRMQPALAEESEEGGNKRSYVKPQNPFTIDL